MNETNQMNQINPPQSRSAILRWFLSVPATQNMTDHERNNSSVVCQAQACCSCVRLVEALREAEETCPEDLDHTSYSQ